jgi:hypothetical protein
MMPRNLISGRKHMITHLRLTIEKLKREIYGPRNERKARLIEQMELELEELEAAAAEDKLMAEKANENNTTAVRAFTPSARFCGEGIQPCLSPTGH